MITVVPSEAPTVVELVRNDVAQVLVVDVVMPVQVNEQDI